MIVQSCDPSGTSNVYDQAPGEVMQTRALGRTLLCLVLRRESDRPLRAFARLSFFSHPDSYVPHGLLLVSVAGAMGLPFASVAGVMGVPPAVNCMGACAFGIGGG